MTNFYPLKVSLLSMVLLLGVHGNPNQNENRADAAECSGKAKPVGSLCREGRGVCVYRNDKYGNEGHKECIELCDKDAVPMVDHATPDTSAEFYIANVNVSYDCDEGYTGAPSVTCGTNGVWGPVSGACEQDCLPDASCAAYEYMVSGANPVANDKLTASTFWCDTHGSTNVPDCHAAHYARLDSTGWLTGAWVPSILDANQWIQADFGESREVSAIVLKGRHYVYDYNWVTSFEVSVSTDGDCNSWSKINDCTGSPKVFEGTSGSDVTVTRHLPVNTMAQCVRVHPITWYGIVALRFDVLRCA